MHDTHIENEIPKNLKKANTSRVMLIIGVCAVALLAVFAIGIIPLEMRNHRLAQDSQQIRDTLPIVDAVPPKSDDQPIDLALPGNSRAWQDTSLYTRTTGFLKNFTHDIGDHVHANEVLGVLSAPDLDDQVKQAAAAVTQAKANVISADNALTNDEATYERYKGLVPTGGVTQENLDTKETARNQSQASLAAANAAVDVANANLQQLQAQQSFETIVAPFDGTLTERPFDVGALIPASTSGTGTALFRVEQTDKLRIFTDVPESYVPLLKVGQNADFTVESLPGRRFIGVLARTAGAIDPVTKELRTQVNIDNHDGKLTSGMYGTVTFHILRDHPTLTVPTSALLYESNGTQVAVVSKQGDNTIVHFRPIKLGRDLGREIEVTDGLSPTDAVVSNPGEKISDGGLVQLAPPSTPPPPPATAANHDTSPTTRSAGL